MLNKKYYSIIGLYVAKVIAIILGAEKDSLSEIISNTIDPQGKYTIKSEIDIDLSMLIDIVNYCKAWKVDIEFTCIEGYLHITVLFVDYETFKNILNKIDYNGNI